MTKQSKISFSIDKKLISLVMIASVVSITASAFLSFNSATEILETRMGDQLLSESTLRGNSILSLIHTRIIETQVLATDPMIRNLVEELNQLEYDPSYYSKVQEKRRDFLIQVQAYQELVGFSIGFEDVKVIGKDGRVFFSLVRLPKTDNFSQDERFIRGLVEPFAEFIPAEPTGSKMMITMPIYGKDGRDSGPIGVIIATMRTAEINAVLLNRSGLGETGEAYMVNEDFLMISESRFIEDAPFNQVVDTLPVRECFENGNEISGVYPDYRGVSIFGFSFCARDLGFVLLAEIDEAENLQPVSILQDRIFLTGIIIIVGMAFFAFFLSKLISRPIIKLKDASVEVGEGNYDVRTNIKTRDEIGQLSESFDTMAQKIQESIITIKNMGDVIKQQEDILLHFSKESENYSVCIVDIKDSTKITAKLTDSESSSFYRIFLNSMAMIVRDFEGRVVKNIGDALLFYFPNTYSRDIDELKKVLNCCSTMIASHEKINDKLKEENLPTVDYKISATYGSVRVAKTTTSSVNDIFGSTVNRCAKINPFSPRNGFIIGETLYELVKSLEEYSFEKILTKEFTVYSVKKK